MRTTIVFQKVSTGGWRNASRSYTISVNKDAQQAVNVS